jgi:hypothetical protein
VTRLVEVRVQEGRIQGPAFCNAQGGIARSRDYKFALKERLQSIQVNQVGLIPGDVDILEDFGVSCLFMQGTTSTARTRGVSDKIVDLINRWRKFGPRVTPGHDSA